MKPASLILINGSYSPKSTKEILFSLVQDKINFLNLKLLSFDQEFSNGKSRISQRIKELQSERDALLQYLDQFDEGSQELNVKCEIQIESNSASLVA